MVLHVNKILSFDKSDVKIEPIYFEIPTFSLCSFLNKGITLRLDTWDGWVEFLQGCLRGHRYTVQSHLSEKKAVMRSDIPFMNKTLT